MGAVDENLCTSGTHAKAAALRSSGNRLPPARRSLRQARVEDGPEVLSETINATPALPDENPTAQLADAVPTAQVPAGEEDTVPEHL